MCSNGKTLASGYVLKFFEETSEHTYRPNVSNRILIFFVILRLFFTLTYYRQNHLTDIILSSFFFSVLANS